ncbi:hypothetical protein JOC55_002620 [Paenibacillus sacheonensis]|nr:hypothetical protein [Paenibacillus sacheonensis]
MPRQGFEKLSAVLTEIVGPSDRQTTMLIMQQMFAAILSPIVKGTFAQKHKSMDAEEQLISASVEEQIDFFLDHYFYKYAARRAES